MYRRGQRTRKKELHRSIRNSPPHIFLRLRLELSQTSAPLRSDPDPLAPFDRKACRSILATRELTPSRSGANPARTSAQAPPSHRPASARPCPLSVEQISVEQNRCADRAAQRDFLYFGAVRPYSSIICLGLLRLKAPPRLAPTQKSSARCHTTHSDLSTQSKPLLNRRNIVLHRS